MGVVLIFIYINTFVVAIFTIDEYRMLGNYNAFVPCYKHKEKPKLWCDFQLMNRVVKHIYTNYIMTKPGKIIVLMTTVAVTSYSFTGLLRLEQKFDPNWFIPQRTYLSKFLDVKRELYPDQGYEAAILMGQLNYTQELHHIANMVEKISYRTDIGMFVHSFWIVVFTHFNPFCFFFTVHKISSWVEPFHEFVSDDSTWNLFAVFTILFLTLHSQVEIYHEKDFFNETLTDYDLRFYLSQFLHTNDGGKYRANFRFKSKLVCGVPVPEIMVSTIDFKYKRFNGRNNYLPAMHTIQHIVENSQLTSGDGFATVWGRIYGNWVTDEVCPFLSRFVRGPYGIVSNFCLYFRW